MEEMEKREFVNHQADAACFMMDAVWLLQDDGTWRNASGAEMIFGQACGRSPWTPFWSIVGDRRTWIGCVSRWLQKENLDADS